MIKKKIALVLVLSLVLTVTLIATYAGAEKPELLREYHPTQRDVFLKIVPQSDTDISGKVVVDISLVNHGKEAFLSSKPIADPWRDQVAVWLNDDKVLLGYDQIYDIKLSTVKDIDLPFEIWNATISPNHAKIGFVGKRDSLVKIWSYDINSDSFRELYSIKKEDWGNNFEPIVYVDWGTDNELYFDAPVNAKPCILKYDFTKNSASLIKETARIPMVSDDGSMFGYLISDTYNGNGQLQKETVIENRENLKTAKYPWYRALLFDSDSVAIIGMDNVTVLNSWNLVEVKKAPIEGRVMLPKFKNKTLIFNDIKLEKGKLTSITNKNLSFAPR